jgi:RNA polymerase sigma-70 factor (ECF subfamily)
MKNVKEKQFEELVKQYKRTIYSVCYMFSRDKEEINDLFQEILIRLWKGYDSFRAESDVRTWIYRVALNCCLNADKKRRRGSERVPLSVDIDPFEDTDDRALQTKRLYARINRLGLVDRGIILLWLEGLSYEEIGAIMGISVKNVSFQLHRIKVELKKSNL